MLAKLYQRMMIQCAVNYLLLVLLKKQKISGMFSVDETVSGVCCSRGHQKRNSKHQKAGKLAIDNADGDTRWDTTPRMLQD